MDNVPQKTTTTTANKQQQNNNNKNGHINAEWQIPVPYGSKLHIPPTNYHFLYTHQEPYKKPNS